MRVSALVQAIAADLVAIGNLGDESTAAVAAKLAAAMEGPLTARVLESLGEVAAGMDRSSTSGHAELRLIGGDAELIWVEAPEAADGVDDDDTSARITLRLSGQLKARIEAASARDGVSVNTFIVRALGQASNPSRASSPRVGRRLSGYGRA